MLNQVVCKNSHYNEMLCLLLCAINANAAGKKNDFKIFCYVHKQPRNRKNVFELGKRCSHLESETF